MDRSSAAGNWDSLRFPLLHPVVTVFQFPCRRGLDQSLSQSCAGSSASCCYGFAVSSLLSTTFVVPELWISCCILFVTVISQFPHCCGLDLLSQSCRSSVASYCCYGFSVSSLSCTRSVAPELWILFCILLLLRSLSFLVVVDYRNYCSRVVDRTCWKAGIWTLVCSCIRLSCVRAWIQWCIQQMQKFAAYI